MAADLDREMPYEEEDQLEAFLSRRGIATVSMRFVEEHGGRFGAGFPGARKVL